MSANEVGLGLPSGLSGAFAGIRQGLQDLADSIATGAKSARNMNIGTGIAVGSVDLADAYRHGTLNDMAVQGTGFLG